MLCSHGRTHANQHHHLVLLVLLLSSDEAAIEETFCKSCPKFIIPGSPNYDDERLNTNQEALQLQLKLFMAEVKRQLVLPTIRSYLKLYTTIPISKLAKFLEVEEEVLRAHLFMFKYKTRSLVWEGGPATEGSLVSFTDIEFYIDGVCDDDDGDDARLVYGWLTCCVCVSLLSASAGYDSYCRHQGHQDLRRLLCQLHQQV